MCVSAPSDLQSNQYHSPIQSIMASVHNNMYEREEENLHMSGDARIGKRQTDSNRTSHYFTNEIDANSNRRLKSTESERRRYLVQLNMST